MHSVGVQASFRRNVVMKGLSMKIEYMPSTALLPYAQNARTHSKKQIKQIASSIQRFGFCNPVLIDDQNRIIAGHGRLEAAKLLDMDQVPTVRLSHLSETERRAYVLADNRLAERAGWDRELLRIELQGLIDLNFDIELTGFDTADVDLMIEEMTDVPPNSEDAVPEASGEIVTQPGDLWLLGQHTLLCGDARDDAAYASLMSDQKAQFIFTDPPYNVPIEGHVSGLGRIRHREFAMGCGEMSSTQFTSFLREVFELLCRHSIDGSIHQICMDWRHMAEMLAAGTAVYSELKNLCIWNKNNAGMGSFYRSKHELVFVWKCGTAQHINNFGLGQFGRFRSNVWDYAGVNTFKSGRDDELAMHPTVKPVALVIDAIKDCSKRGGLILDPFCGSGTVLIAAERSGRKARALEIDPHYVDVAVKRWERFTGKSALLCPLGETFDEISDARATLSAKLATASAE
jgi:DNA modification methylase